MNKTEIVRQYRAKHPNMPSHKLARIVYNDHKLLYKDTEDVRAIIRYIEGKRGKSLAKSAKGMNSDFFTDARPVNPYNLPKSDEDKYEPVVISGFKRIGILSDVHIPYHNLEALETAFDGLRDVIGPEDAILLNGDIIDCHRLSRWAKDPKKRDFKAEVDMLKQFFESLAKTFGCRIIYKLGNHEDRYQRFLYEKASEIAGIEDFEFSNIIRAREHNIQMVEASRFMQFGGIIGIHGHEFMGSGSGDLIARSLYQKGTVNAFQGHNHRTDNYIRRNPFTGEVTATYSIGCMSELHPAYNVLQKHPWNYGYAWMELDGDKFIFHNKHL